MQLGNGLAELLILSGEAGTLLPEQFSRVAMIVDLCRQAASLAKLSMVKTATMMRAGRGKMIPTGMTRATMMMAAVAMTVRTSLKAMATRAIHRRQARRQRQM